MSSGLAMNNNTVTPSLPSSGYVEITPVSNGLVVMRASDGAVYTLMQVPTDFLTDGSCLISGFEVTAHATDLSMVDCASGYKLKNGAISKVAAQEFDAANPSTTYYLDIDNSDGSFSYAESGGRPADPVPIAEVTIDGSTEVTGVTDKRATSLRLKRPSMPVGTTAERPALPQKGEFRYNTTTAAIECYDGSSWV